MTIIIESASYVLRQNILPLESHPGEFHVQFTSQLLHAKNPEEQRTVCCFTGDGDTLRAMRYGIDQALGDS